MDRFWLSQCNSDNRVISRDGREMHVLREHVLKLAAPPKEHDGDPSKPDLAALAKRDENEARALELVRAQTYIPVPRVVYKGDGFVVHERLEGVYHVKDPRYWERLIPEEQESARRKVRGWIEQLYRVPNPEGKVRSLLPSGELMQEIFKKEPGPFRSTLLMLNAYIGVKGMPSVQRINTRARSVFSHMNLDVTNIIWGYEANEPVGLINWECAAFFPEGGKSVHQSTRHPTGWESLFEGMETPVLNLDEKWDDDVFKDETWVSRRKGAR